MVASDGSKQGQKDSSFFGWEDLYVNVDWGIEFRIEEVESTGNKEGQEQSLGRKSVVKTIH